MPATKPAEHDRGWMARASAPCRIDMGGTLDIGAFYYALRAHNPCTFNVALDLRTEVSVHSHDAGWIKVTSGGFKPARFPAGRAPFQGPLGLIFAVAEHFGAEGVHIHIESASPPLSGLGGSSAAAVALSAALSRMGDQRPYGEMSRRQTALLAQALEAAVAGVACGYQDQLAAAYGGVNSWNWNGIANECVFSRKPVLEPSRYRELENCLLVAYVGRTHVSADINGRWLRQFLSGRHRRRWIEIVSCTRRFSSAISAGDYREAAAAMRREADLRIEMTPDVFDDMGYRLAQSAAESNCAARFTGAGGGGCVWSVGEPGDIDRLKPVWQTLVNRREAACLLNWRVDDLGLVVDVS